jgi:hypothetical protein
VSEQLPVGPRKFPLTRAEDYFHARYTYETSGLQRSGLKMFSDERSGLERPGDNGLGYKMSGVLKNQMKNARKLKYPVYYVRHASHFY